MHNRITESIVDTIKMGFLFNMRDSSNYNFIITTILTLILTTILNNEYFFEYIKWYFEEFCQKFKIFNYNKLVLTGSRHVKGSDYFTRTDFLFSDRFTAFWFYINKNNLNNSDIKCLKEFSDSCNIYDEHGDSKNSRRSINNFNNKMEKDIFIVNQKRPFHIGNNINCKVSIENEKLDDKKNTTIENFTIEIYSYIHSMKYMRDFLDKLYEEYKNELIKKRQNKKFIYTLIGNTASSKYDSDDYINIWEECEFNSTRNFNNIFFDQKKQLIDKLNFFEKNFDWYKYEGHPYTFGIGLHGPPGTGKTSIIKCIANKLNRHIVIIPLNKIKTQTEFSQYFFEDKYNRHNTDSINFDKKIIVFEDIDCMTNIVKNRNIKNKSSDNSNNSNNFPNISSLENQDNNETNSESVSYDSADDITNNSIISKNLNNQNKLLNKLAKKLDEDHDDNMLLNIDKPNNDKITLSFILNVIDGIRETPGRILIITSNNYNSLDPALIRPGRIDMTLEMRNASVDIIKEMYNHYYNDIIPDEICEKMSDYEISHAKIVNLRLEYNKGSDFLAALLKEFEKKLI